MSLLMWYPQQCSYCLLSTCCHPALHVPPPCITFFRADVTLVPVNLAELLRPIGNDTFHSAVFCIPRRRIRDVSPLSQTAAESFVFFVRKAGYFLFCTSMDVSDMIIRKTATKSIVFHVFIIQNGVIFSTHELYLDTYVESTDNL